jgi:hypothetical protein
MTSGFLPKADTVTDGRHVSKVPTAEMVDIHYFERVRAVNFADRFWVVLVVKAGFGASARHNQVRGPIDSSTI